MTLAPGLHRISAAEYHADPCPRPSLSSTLARKLLSRSPLHAWTACPRLNPDWVSEDRKTFDIGRAAHREMLGAGGDYAVIPEDVLASNGAASTKEAKAFIAECREAGITPLKEDEADAIRTMAAIARHRLAGMGIVLDPGRSELVALAEIGGCPVRAMLDNLPERGPVYDFKTAENASPEGARRAAESYGWDVQAAHYLDTVEAATGERRRFRFVVQEKEPPYEVGVYELHDAESDDADWMLDARHKAAEARAIWSECLRTGVWPGYPPMVAVLGAASYYRAKWADRPCVAPVPQAAMDRAMAWQSPGGMK